MAKPHTTLSPTINLLLIAVWGAVALVLLFVIEPNVPLAIALVGAGLGAVGGIMQHLSFTQAASEFRSAASLLDVRRALKATTWGSCFIAWLYFSKAVLVILAFLLIHQPFLRVVLGYLAGYISLMFVRELVTLRDTFHLQRLSSQHVADSTPVT